MNTEALVRDDTLERLLKLLVDVTQTFVKIPKKRIPRT